jgi:hypothetical protein
MRKPSMKAFVALVALLIAGEQQKLGADVGR